VIELGPGQEMPLATADGEPLHQLRMGLGWDKAPTAGFIGTGAPEVDLDASATEYGEGQWFDMAFYNNLETRDGAVVHLGDNRTGRGEGDDEVIAVDLDRVHPRIDTVVFLVSSYHGHTLEWIDRAYCRLVAGDEELARFSLTLDVRETGLVMVKIFRDGDRWRLRAIGEGIDARIPAESIEAMKRFL
jgi:stress response protein SCP2